MVNKCHKKQRQMKTVIFCAFMQTLVWLEYATEPAPWACAKEFSNLAVTCIEKVSESAVINLNILMWISRARAVKIRRIDNATRCQQPGGLSRGITHVLRTNMFRDVSVFGSELRICQAVAVSSSIHLTFISHPGLFIPRSIGSFPMHVIVTVKITMVYVKRRGNFHQIVGYLLAYLHGFFIVGTGTARWQDVE